MWAMVGTLTVILSGLMMVCKILCRLLAIAVDDREALYFYGPRLKLPGKGLGLGFKLSKAESKPQ
jgi:hypothetical protein